MQPEVGDLSGQVEVEHTGLYPGDPGAFAAPGAPYPRPLLRGVGPRRWRVSVGRRALRGVAGRHDVEGALGEARPQHLLVELADAGLGYLLDDRPALRQPEPRHPV